MEALRRGCRGFLVQRLQKGLNGGREQAHRIGEDGIYGAGTVGAVGELQRQRGMAGEVGCADALVYRALGLEWPGELERCLQLTAGFEGTGFTGACGPAETGDQAGVTYGIIGFTSGNGEFQRLLLDVAARRGDFWVVVARCLGVDDAAAFRNAIALGRSDPKEFERLALVSGSVRPRWAAMFHRMGEWPEMVAAQLEATEGRYWKRAEIQAAALFGGLGGVPVRAKALMFDIAVQNGGLAQAEMDRLEARFAQGASFGVRMQLVVETVLERLRQKGQRVAIIQDVQARKRTIALGAGEVHGRLWSLSNFGL